ncbi:hypothetical protein [Actinomyces culturomici]|uniref:hypothetical protein n=1 Tax=Actinomyces culturomici TaxID=1926276 RepID=UPI000E208231|nr:hypothetical protein [Actinomyces culturomici]
MSGWRILAILALVGLAIVVLDRIGLWAEERGWIYWRKRQSKSAAAAFDALNRVYNPAHEYFLEEKEREKILPIEVESGAPPISVPMPDLDAEATKDD